MKGLNRYLELTEHGRPMEEPPTAPDLLAPTLLVLERARSQGQLAVEGAWRLSARECRRLEEKAGYSPPGGWANLAGLACGCGILQAQRDKFEARASAKLLHQWGERGLRRQLLEAFSRRLVPPATAAGLLILLGLHPAWGLRVAHSVHSRGQADGAAEAPRPGEPGWRDESLFPADVAKVVEQTVFSAIAALVATLRKLAPEYRYPIDALAGVVCEACRFARRAGLEALGGESRAGLSPFLDLDQQGGGTSQRRALDFATADLLESVLVPCGAAARFNDGTFCLFDGGFEEVLVGHLTPDEQAVKLSWMLAGDSGCMVA